MYFDHTHLHPSFSPRPPHPNVSPFPLLGVFLFCFLIQLVQLVLLFHRYGQFTGAWTAVLSSFYGQFNIVWSHQRRKLMMGLCRTDWPVKMSVAEMS